eukprot:11190427-Lingulodinium_polyedra.AAC.1
MAVATTGNCTSPGSSGRVAVWPPLCPPVPACIPLVVASTPPVSAKSLSPNASRCVVIPCAGNASARALAVT